MHPFEANPHRTFAALSWPVLVALIAEPMTGIVDTALLARLGATPAAALGVAVMLLSSAFWIFNFLGIGAQTEVARALGAGDRARAAGVAGQAMALAAALGLAVLGAAWMWLPAAARALGAEGAVEEQAVAYLQIRLVGAPAVLVTTAAFGVLRGLARVRIGLVIAVGINLLNVVLAVPLSLGSPALGVPGYGVVGAAWATTASQILGALCALAAVRAALPLRLRLRPREALGLLTVGADLILRTAANLAFLLLATRAATRVGADGGAAHQAIRQVWLLSSLVLDAYAATAQTLVGYFVGAGRILVARRVARVAVGWAVGTGCVLGLAMLAGESVVGRLLVPTSARAVFAAGFAVAAWTQVPSALAFVTDGIHWGTGDYRYLRNGMFVAFAIGVGGLALVPGHLATAGTLAAIWGVTVAWTCARAAVGLWRLRRSDPRAPLAVLAPLAPGSRVD